RGGYGGRKGEGGRRVAGRRKFLDAIDQPAELVPAEQSREPRAAAPDANISTETRHSIQRQPRLIRVKFPRMEVEYAGTRHFADAALHHKQREEPKVPAAGDRQVLAEGAQRQRGKLEQLVPLAADDERRARGIRHAVAVVANGEDRRVVTQTELGKDVDGPRGVAHHAERRGAEADDGASSRLLQGIDAGADVFAKRVGLEAVDAAVVPAMAGDFVAFVGHALDEPG